MPKWVSLAGCIAEVHSQSRLIDRCFFGFRRADLILCFAKKQLISNLCQQGDSVSLNSFPFRIRRILGRGAAADVWLADHQGSGESVALKFFLEPVEHDFLTAETLLRETRLIARAAHPHILQVHGYGRSESEICLDDAVVIQPNRYYIVSEFITGGTLANQIGRLEWPEIYRTLRDILLGLAHVHAQGIVHLDLKPANILLSIRGAVIADFGIAKRSRQLRVDRDTGLQGTPSYMAPEQGAVKPHLYGPWTDLYGVGCIAHTLISGRPPYQADSWIEMLAEHRHAAIPQLEGHHDVPLGFDAWLNKLLAKDFSTRFQRASAALRYLDAMAGDLRVDLAGGTPSSSLTQAALETTPMDSTMMSPRPDFDYIKAGSTSGLPTVNWTHLDWTFPKTPNWTMKTIPGLDRTIIVFEDNRLVGRVVEQKRLWAHLTSAMTTQQTRLLTLSGAEGMGKTALCRWLQTAAHETIDADMLSLSHRPIDGRTLNPLIKAIGDKFQLSQYAEERHAAIIAEQLALAASDPLVCDFASIYEAEQTTASTMLDQGVISIAEKRAILGRMLSYLAQKRPFILVIDDAQWASGSLGFLKTYLNSPDAAPLCVLLAHDGQLVDESSLYPNFHWLVHTVPTEDLKLQRLDESELHDWLSSMSHLDPQKIEQLIPLSEGNPLFVKVMVVQSAELESAEFSADEFSIRDLILRHFERLNRKLSTPASGGLMALAILGETVSSLEWRLLVAALGLDDANGALDEILRTQIVSMSEENTISFNHHVYQAACLSILERDGKRIQLHAQAAAILSDLSSPPQMRIAQHYESAEAPLMAAESWMDAALTFRDLTDYKNFQWALVRAALCYRTAGVRLTSPEWCTLSVYWTLCQRVLGRSHAVLKRIKGVCASLEEAKNWSILAMAFQEWARIERISRSVSAGLPLLRKAQDAAQKSGELDLIMGIELTLSDFCLLDGRITDAQRSLKVLRHLFEDHPQMVSVRWHVAYLDRESRLAKSQGDHVRALRYSEAALTRCSDDSSKAARANQENAVGEICRHLGYFERAIEHYSRSYALNQEFNSIELALPVYNMAMVRFEQGRYDASFELMKDARSAPNRGGKFMGLAFDLGYVCAGLCSGRSDDFSALDERLDELAVGPWADRDLVILLESAIGHAIAVGNGPSAQRLLRIFENQVRLLKSEAYAVTLADLRVSFDRFLASVQTS